MVPGPVVSGAPKDEMASTTVSRALEFGVGRGRGRQAGGWVAPGRKMCRRCHAGCTAGTCLLGPTPCGTSHCLSSSRILLALPWLISLQAARAHFDPGGISGSLRLALLLFCSSPGESIHQPMLQLRPGVSPADSHPVWVDVGGRGIQHGEPHLGGGRDAVVGQGGAGACARGKHTHDLAAWLGSKQPPGSGGTAAPATGPALPARSAAAWREAVAHRPAPWPPPAPGWDRS